MDVTRDVILDLLPLYLAGEASPATRALIDRYLKDHPDVAERVRRVSEEPLTALPPVSPPPDLEMRTLRRTMRLMNWQHRLFALALWLTGAPLMAVISVQQGHFNVHFLMRDYPTQLWVCAQLAAICWIIYFVIRHHLRTKR
jgi:hypothetical protein